MSLLSFFRREPAGPPKLYTATETAEQRGKEWKQWEQVAVHDGRCPNCGHDKFYEGPSGGMSTNVQCVKCGIRWNSSPFPIPWEFIGWSEERQEVDRMLKEKP